MEPLGVRGRNSNNDLIREKLGWDYEQTLEEGIKKTMVGYHIKYQRIYMEFLLMMTQTIILTNHQR